MTNKLFRKKRSKFDEIREQRKKRRGDTARANALAKRRKLEDGTAEQVGEFGEEADNVIEDDQGEYLAFEDTTGEQPPQDEAVFYGLLDPDEQTYYANVNSKIVSNDFESEDDRRAFIDALYRESDGKELKLASSQSCSRYFEKIIMLSTPEQLRTFFGKLLGHFTHLVQHRFGSHVCETLFVESAKYVAAGEDKQQTREEGSVTMESLFLQAVTELQPNIGYMLTDRFASHTIRVLLLVLSGESLNDESTKTLLASKKKEKVDAPVQTDVNAVASCHVPKTFGTAMKTLIDAAISNLDTTYLRALATHPTGNPVLQLLLRSELANSDKGRQLKEGSLYNKLISSDSIEEGAEGSKFVLGLTYDSAGSHLVEVLAVHAPGRTFKKLYKNVWKDKMASMAKNEIASYVAIRILERLGKDDLVEARAMILPELASLLSRRRTVIIKCLVDRSVARGLDLNPLAKALKEACGTDASLLILKLLGVERSTESREDDATTAEEKQDSQSDTHGSLLAQAMTQAPDVSTLIQESLLAMNTQTLLDLSRDPAASRVLQSALKTSTASIGFRKQMISRYYNHVVELANDAVGSYLVDALWDATNGLHFMKEKIAAELAAHEADLRDSRAGRIVWRNWSMDTHQRRPAEWRILAKGQSGDAPVDEDSRTPFQRAQDRHVEQKQQRKPYKSTASRPVSASA